MEKKNAYRLISGVACIVGVVLTVANWTDLIRKGSYYVNGSMIGPVAICWGLAFSLFRPSDYSDSIVAEHEIGTTARPRYPKPPLAVSILMFAGIVLGIVNWYLMAHYK